MCHYIPGMVRVRQCLTDMLELFYLFVFFCVPPRWILLVQWRQMMRLKWASSVLAQPVGKLPTFNDQKLIPKTVFGSVGFTLYFAIV